VTKRDQVVAAIRAVVDEFKQLDVFIANAGTAGRVSLASKCERCLFELNAKQSVPLHELTDDDYDKVFELNSRASFICSQEALKIFLAQKKPASIVHVVSTAGLQGHPRQCVYNMSKQVTGASKSFVKVLSNNNHRSAQAQLVRCTAIEYGPVGIRCNGICPSYMFAYLVFSRRVFLLIEFTRRTALTAPIYADEVMSRSPRRSVFFSDPVQRRSEIGSQTLCL
jgi:NAD(P)-dependent dehydrogenase (short-subunit alcohol dehydrogenase family)